MWNIEVDTENEESEEITVIVTTPNGSTTEIVDGYIGSSQYSRYLESADVFDRLSEVFALDADPWKVWEICFEIAAPRL